MTSSYEYERERSNSKMKSGATAGALSFLTALGLGTFDKSAGLTVGFQIPFTDAHYTFGAAAGNPDAVSQVLPDYLNNHYQNVSDGFNFSSNSHLGVAGERVINVIGHQNGAPGIDLNVSLGDHLSHIVITPELLGLAGLAVLGTIATGIIRSRRNK